MSAPARGGFILLGRFVAVTGINYLFALALAWLLAPAEFGEVAVLQAIILLAVMVLNSGFPWMLAWTLAGSERGDEAARVFRTSLVGNVLFGVLLALVVIAIDRSGALGMGADFRTPVIIAALTLPLFALSSVGRGALHGTGRFGGIAMMQTGDAAVRCAVGLSLVALLGMETQAVALAFLVAAVVASVISAWLLRDLLPGRGSFAPLSTYTRTFPIFAGVAGFALLLTLDILTLKAVGAAAGVTAATVGLYQAGAMLARAPYFIGDALVDAVFPYMVLRKDSPARSHGYFSAAVRWVALAVLPVEIVLIVNPEALLALFFPASYGAAAPLLRLLAVGSIGALGTGIFGKALQALGKRKAAAMGTVGALVVELALIAALVPSFGAEGAATAFTVGAWLGALFLVVRYFQYQQVSLPHGTSLSRYALALSLLSALSLVGVFLDAIPGLIWIFVAAFAYAGSLPLLQLVTLAELRHLGSVVAGLVPLGGLRLGFRRAGRILTNGALWLSLRPRLALALLVAPIAFVVIADNVTRSPDTLYDEVVYTQAARNVTTDGDLTWSEKPIFVHPPLYFLVQGAWLTVTGSLEGGIFEAIHDVRYLTSAFTALAVCVVALLAFELAASAGKRRRLLLAGAAALLAAFDPVLLRFGRVGMIESLALLFGLLTLYVAWRWRGRSAAVWISSVGLLTAISLLVKEVTIFLVIAPLLFSFLRRDVRLAVRSLAALGVGLAGWATFVGWAFTLGLEGRFAEDKLVTAERLLGFLQVTGWNRPTVSFVEALRVSAPQYFPSYLLLAGGAVALCWLWLRRNNEVGAYLTAWLLSTYAFGAYTVARGQLNEQFFTYLIPGAIVATVLAAEASFVWATNRRPRTGPSVPAWQLAVVAPIAAIVLLSSASGANWWRLYHRGSDNGIEQMTAFVQGLSPTCTAFNASGDVEKYALSLTGHPVTSLGSGPLAASRGVRYFFYSPKDVWARYGKMNPDLEAWLQRFGTRVASYPSHTYWGVELWRVGFWPFDPIADIQPVPRGVFVNVEGSACGGYPVRDGPDGAFIRAYQALGGKPLLGRPLSRPWREEGRAFQLFDTLVLASTPTAGGGRPPVEPVRLVTLLSSRAPAELTARDLPRAARPPARTRAAALELLTDEPIAEAYLESDPARATRLDWDEARQRWGAPVGPPRLFPRSFLRQPFERVVFERRIGDPRYGVRLARSLGQAALDADLVPARARKTLPVPNLEDKEPPTLPSSIRGFIILFSGFLGCFACVIAALSAKRVPSVLRARTEALRTRPRPVAAEPAPVAAEPAPVAAEPAPVAAEPAPVPAEPAPAAAISFNGRLGLNSATLEELTALPGVGTVTAERILAYRETHGALTSVADLLAVPGIGPARFKTLEELVEP